MTNEAVPKVAKTVILNIVEKSFSLIIKELDFSISVQITTNLTFEIAPDD